MSRIFSADVSHGHAVDGVEYRDVAVEQLCLVLGEVSDLHIVSDLERAGEWDLAHDTLDKGRFALAVLAHESHFLAALYSECGMVEYLMVAVGFANIVGYDGIVARAGCRRKAEVEVRCVDLVDLDALESWQAA